MIKDLKIRKKIDAYNIMKIGLPTMLVTSLIFTGCNSINASEYYLVHEDNNYYICKRVGTFNKSDDYEFRSILNNEVIGSICATGDSFNYESHRFSTNFLCELQVVSLKDLFGKDSISETELLNIANSDLYELGDNYLKNSKYYFESNFNYDQNSNLQLFEYKGSLILGYDISSKKTENYCKYIFSIADNDVIKTEYDEQLNIYEINIPNKDKSYISYSETLDLLASEEVKKVLQK